MIFRLNWDRERTRANVHVQYFKIAVGYWGLAPLLQPAPLGVRAAVRRAEFQWAKRQRLLRESYIALVVFAVLDLAMGPNPFYRAIPVLPVDDWSRRFANKLEAARIVTTEGAVTFAMIVIVCYAVIWKLWQRVELLVSTKKEYADKGPVPYLCALMLRNCMYAANSSLPARKASLRQVDRIATALERSLLRLASDGVLVPRMSPRKAALRRHAGLVGAALRRERIRLDSEPKAALRALASMSCLILTRHSQRRFGALLDEADLANLEPVRDREWVRLTTAALLTAGAFYGLSIINTPATVLPIVGGALGLLIFSTVYGTGAPSRLDLFDSMRGIQRP